MAAPCPSYQPFLVVLVEYFVGGLGALRILRLGHVQAENRFLRDRAPFLAGRTNSGYIFVGVIPVLYPSTGENGITACVNAICRAGSYVRDAELIFRMFHRDSANDRLGEKISVLKICCFHQFDKNWPVFVNYRSNNSYSINQIGFKLKFPSHKLTFLFPQIRKRFALRPSRTSTRGLRVEKG